MEILKKLVLKSSETVFEFEDRLGQYVLSRMLYHRRDSDHFKKKVNKLGEIS